MANIKNIEEKIQKTLRNADTLNYLKNEFEGKLYGSVPNGDVKLYQMIAFAKEYDYLLEDIIRFSKEL